MRNPPVESGQLSSDDDAWIRIQEVFSSALDLSKDDRVTFLARSCGDDASLRVQVERLLYFSDQTGGPLDRGLTHLVEADDSSTPDGFVPGDIVCSRFRITRFIGKGGMGEVFEAEDFVLGESIAIKTIRPDIAKETGLVERLRREVQLSRQVSHTNVCRVFELWEHEGPNETRVSFLTMELLKGETLAQRIEAGGPVSPEVALPLIRQIAEGLGEVHRAGIVHRDLKPSNLYLVGKDDGTLRVVVTDFGLARPVNPEEHSRTQSGLVFGTPAYMAPEQFDSGEATFASDIYSLGVTIFEMVTGRKHPLTVPSAFVPGIGANWDEALQKCWNPDSAQRPKHPGDVVALLETAVGKSKLRFLRPVAALAATAALVAAAGYEITLPSPIPQFRLSNITSDDGLTWDPSLSADGQTIAYASDSSKRGDLDIWVRRLDNSPPRRITDDPANDSAPSISPDGSRVVYDSDRSPRGIYMREINGGPERLVSRFGTDPFFSPDGKRIVYWTGNEGQFTGNIGRIFITDIDRGVTRQLATSFPDARHPVWSPNGDEILFEGCGPGCTDAETKRDWWRIGIDGGHPVATGALGVVLRQGLSLYFNAPVWQDGNIFFSARMTNDTNIWRISENPPLLRDRWKANPIMSSTEEAIHPSMSRDGSIAFAGLSTKANLWLLPLNAGAGTGPSHRRLGSNVEIDSTPSISRDGNRILYFRRQGNERRMILWEKEANEILNVPVPAGTRGIVDASGTSIVYTKPRADLRDLYERHAPAWTETLLLRDSGELVDLAGDTSIPLLANQAGIASVDLRSGKSTRIIRNGELTFDQAAVSPDGKWIAYAGTRDSQHTQLFVAPFGNAGVDTTRSQAITDDRDWNDKPRWTADGRAVVYISDRDGFTCIWKYPFSPVGARSEPRALVHFHQARLSPMHLSRVAFNLSLSGNALLYNAADLRANIWIARP